MASGSRTVPSARIQKPVRLVSAAAQYSSKGAGQGPGRFEPRYSGGGDVRMGCRRAFAVAAASAVRACPDRYGSMKLDSSLKNASDRRLVIFSPSNKILRKERRKSRHSSG